MEEDLAPDCKGDYSLVFNDAVQDYRLSWKARGLYIYLISNGNKRSYTFSEMTKGSSHDGWQSTKSAFRELLRYGYISRKHIKHYKYQITIYDHPGHY